MPATNLKTFLTKGTKIFITIASLLAIVSWTSWGSMRSLTALVTLPKPELTDTTPPNITANHKIRRSIQKHFLGYSVYIPLEDIVIAQHSANNDDHLTFLMRKACGQAKLYVWIPLKIKLPYLGGKTWEWCWKQN